MKTKISLLLLLISFIGYAQLTNNMVVLKPLSPVALVANGGSSPTFYAYSAYDTGVNTPWGTNNLGSCHHGLSTFTFNYTNGNGASYTAKSWGLNLGGSVAVAAGKLNVGSGSIVFTVSGNFNQQSGPGVFNQGTAISFLGQTITINQNGSSIFGDMVTWNNVGSIGHDCP